ncbi:MAG: IS66 family transposase [Candidatus Acidifodinimicrobium sp.]
MFLLDTGYEHLRTRKFVDNLLKRKREWLFRFVVDPNVEPTNNRAERALRPSVIYRKVSGGTRSPRGSETYDRLFSIFYTHKLRRRNFIRDVPKLITRKEIHPG